MKKAKRTRAEWMQIVSAWRRSGLSAESFATREGGVFTAQRLQAWSKNFGGAVERGSDVGSEALGFVEVTEPKGSAAGCKGECIVVELPNGTSLRLPASIELERVAVLVRSLGIG